MTPLPIAEAAHRFRNVIESLQVDQLELLSEAFVANAHFKDPFNDVTGRDAIVRVFVHGYKNCPNLRFVVDEMAFVPDTRVVFFYWRFLCGAPSDLKLVGVSRVVFDDEGLVVDHVDYWDPAEQLYSQVPVLGALLRWVRGRLSA
ncbi:MAG: hypothetical protein B7X35_08575 [Halothiobacillus sp. 14-56-357]|jgi:steroid delta-isomerase|uniref:nuclear transport factor 2 family protein n=1 Tax=Halothiobacillus sp. 15-55-196 TaxID=1970382 RepID=UPI000BC79144|nr:nuclear transport factor 2 family protein [Halothiobacillus sp. 15-55-196]OZB36520.1 MAG: hypothetical protein B7X44_05780 [Halothiobacillus sp. 15-55-196]OZB55685.1 MAG: hypothetical protein B7X35_08575 [Halothiobacillus sp. 14-56-357]OZB78370.1 MAG: hypothetical protein B7X29_05120 [Halothiobacillus sp. 13-55-115]